MDLKSFKQGIEYLAGATNQRQAIPDPFLVQVGKDGLLSLVSGNEHSTYIWRTGVQTGPDGADAGRDSVDSKTLVQAAKALKGKIDVSFEITKRELRIATSAGGSIKLPLRPPHDLKRPVKDEPLVVFALRDGRLAEWAKGIAVNDPITYNAVQLSFLPQTRDSFRIIATDSYKVFQIKEEATFVSEGVPTDWDEPLLHTRLDFWTLLDSLEGPATVTFGKSGVRVQCGQFEASSINVRARNFPDMVTRYFPEGTSPEIAVELDRKATMNLLKSFPNDDRAVAMTLGDDISFTHRKSGQTLGLTPGRKLGAGSVSFNHRWMHQILGAIKDKKVVIAWSSERLAPIGIRASTNRDYFLLMRIGLT